MKQAKYDVFISYRRTAYDTANLIAVKLRHAGYKVFFDVDTLTAGKFNEQLLEVIKSCKDFILVLPKDALERCHQPDDWVRQEVLCAMEHNKNIIPVMLAGFEWPQHIPAGMEELPNYQSITSAGHEYFDMAMQRLQGYLKSKPSLLNKHLLHWIASVAAILVVCLGIFAYMGWRSTKSVCTDIATQMSSDMGTLDLLADVNNDLAQSIDLFWAKAPTANPEDLADMEKQLRKALDKAEVETDRYLSNFPPPQFGISTLQSIILSFKGINKEELQAFSIFYQTMFDDTKDVIATIRESMEEHDYSKLTKTTLDVNLNCFRYSLNGLYYVYIQQLSHFPQECRNTHNQLSVKWKNYPNGVPFGLTDEEYETFQLQEMARLDAETRKVGSAINYEEQQMDDPND